MNKKLPDRDPGTTLEECRVELFSRPSLNGRTFYGLRLRNTRGGSHEFGGTEETPEQALRWLYEVGVFLEIWLRPGPPERRVPFPETTCSSKQGETPG